MGYFTVILVLTYFLHGHIVYVYIKRSISHIIAIWFVLTF